MDLRKTYNALPWRYALFGILLLVGAIRRFSLPLTPFADGDVLGYLVPTIDLLEHGELTHQGTRSFLYPLLVALLYKLGGTLNAVTVFQHLLGLGTGMVMFAIFERPMFRALGSWWMRLVVAVVQLLCCGFLLLINSIWQYEHFITSQALCTFLLAVELYLLVRIVEGGAKQKQTLWRGALLVFLSLVTYVLMPRFGLALPLLGLLVLVEWYRQAIPWRRWVVPLAVPLAIFVAAVWIPERQLVEKYDKGTDYFPFRQFFYIHADMAKSLIQEDIAHGRSQPYDVRTLQLVDSLLVLPKEPHQQFRYLGFDADTLFIGGIDREIIKVLEARNQNYMYFILHYDKRILTERFRGYVAKVADQLQHYYTGADGYAPISIVEMDKLYNVAEMTLDMVSREPFSRPMLQKYRSDVLRRYGSWHWQSNAIEHLHYFVTFGRMFNMLFIVLLAQLLVLYWRKCNFPYWIKPIQRITLYALATQFALVLTVALIHSFDVGRYGVWIAPASIMATGLMAISVLANFKVVLYPND